MKALDLCLSRTDPVTLGSWMLRVRSALTEVSHVLTLAAICSKRQALVGHILVITTHPEIVADRGSSLRTGSDR